MGPCFEIIAELSNAMDTLKSQIEKLLLECDDKGCGRLKPSLTTAVRINMAHVDRLMHQCRETAMEDSDQLLQPISVEVWADHLKHLILPSLCQLYQLEVSFSSQVTSMDSVMIQTAHFHSICENLLANACITKATEVAVELREEPHCIDLVFRDNGSGISAEQLQPFVSGVSGKSGLGYGRGLHNISRLASNMGAMVQPFKSMQRSGTEVTVSFMKVASSGSSFASLNAFAIPHERDHAVTWSLQSGRPKK